MEQPAGVAEAEGHGEEQQQLGAIAGIGQQGRRLQRVGEHHEHACDEDEQQRQRRQAVRQQQLAHLFDGHATPEQKVLRGDGAGQGDHGAIMERGQQFRVQHPSLFLLVGHMASFSLDAIERG
ncbi:hypothetical protein D3C72_1492220 [compost metagenome]